MNMFSPPLYLNDTIQDELDNYSYHASFESNPTELNYANSNYLVINDEVALPQLRLTPKKWINQQNPLNHRTGITNAFGQPQIVQQGVQQAGERKVVHARRYLPFGSLAERNTQSVSTAVGANGLLTNQTLIRRRSNIDNLRIIRHSSHLSHDANRPKDSNVGAKFLFIDWPLN